MPTFQSKPLRASRSPLHKFSTSVRRHPVLLFGLPFITTLVVGSFGLSTLTQTRYDYNSKKVSVLSKEDELKMRRDRKKIDIREEYFRLQAREDELDDWEPKRIARPEGVPEWGVPPEQPTSSAPRGAIHAEERPAGAASEDDIQEKHLPPSSRPATVLGPDGKPCRACNSKLAFSAAMRASKGVAPPAPTKVVPAPATPAPTTFARSECPPDGDMLGSSTWTFLHSAAAYYPDVPTPIQRSSMLSLLRALPHVYPCVPCAEALGEEYARETRAGGWAEEKLTLESAVKDRRSLARWLCGIHNEVNERLGKQKFDCGAENLDRRWKDGPEDGSCD